MGSRWFCWSTLLLPMIGGQQRVFLKPEEPGEVQGGLVCTSLPGLEPGLSDNLYFACTCGVQGTRATFSLARFAHRLDPSIYSRRLVVDFRDCWALHLTMDQLQLSTMDSRYFRPDIHFLEINVENMYQVQLVQDPDYQAEAILVNPPAHRLAVRLYEVNQVVVDTEAELDKLITEWDATTLQVDLTTTDTAKPDHTFDISGFKPANVFFLTSDREVALQEGKTQFRAVLQELRQAVLARSRHMSLGLALSVAVLTLGIGAMMLATIRRHQLLIESIVYSSLGSLRRVKGTSSGEEGNVTTTTKVDFFPRYSIVNKSRRAQRGGDGGLPAKKEADEGKSDEKKKGKEEKEEEAALERKTPIKPHVPATYSIFTTLKFPPKGKRPSLHTKPPSGKQSKQKTSFLYKESSNNQSKKSVPDTSFYYKDNSSSNYDLTLARKEKEVVAEVHEASPKSVRSVGGSSPVPLLPPRVGRAEGFYSFRTLQERCRKMIQGAKPWPANTKL